MIQTIFAVFLALHGVVHLLYLGHSARVFELQPGLAWPDSSWAFSSFLGNGNIRMIANIVLALAALVFIAGGVGLFIRQDWWRQVVIAASIFSTVMYVLLWNGRFEHLDDNGWVGILINIAILAAVAVFRWPKI